MWGTAVIFGHVWQLETAYRTVCHFVCPWPTFSPSPICYLLGHVPGHAAVIFGHVWQLETAYRTVCHFVCPWPTFSPSPICYLLGHVWQIEMAHHTVCHLVCLWPAWYVTSSWRVSAPNLPRFRSKEGRHI